MGVILQVHRIHGKNDHLCLFFRCDGIRAAQNAYGITRGGALGIGKIVFREAVNIFPIRRHVFACGNAGVLLLAFKEK